MCTRTKYSRINSTQQNSHVCFPRLVSCTDSVKHVVTGLKRQEVQPMEMLLGCLLTFFQLPGPCDPFDNRAECRIKP